MEAMAPATGVLQTPSAISAQSTTSLIILIAISTLLCLLWHYNTARKGTVPAPPGPVGLPLLGNLPFLKPELHTYFAGLAQTFGPIFKLRLGTRTAVVVTSPSVACQILKDHDVIFANRDVPSAARVVTYGGIDIVWTPFGRQWRKLRKICVSRMLSNSTLDSVYGLRRREVRAATKYLHSRAGDRVDIRELVYKTNFNVVTSMLWGGTVGAEERASVGMEFHQVVAKIADLAGTPNVSDFFPGLAWLDLQGVARRMRRLVSQFDRIFDKMIDERLKHSHDDDGRERGDEAGDFLQFLLELNVEADDESHLSLTHVKALLMDMVMGGTDTSSTTVEFAMAELMKKPDILKKVQLELDIMVGGDKIVEESHISKLLYLQAVVKETLRLHPILPLLIPHCSSQTCIVNGYSIPRGTRAFINVWAIHRDPLAWENPLDFDPERFLVGNKHWDFNGNDFSYIPFGSGRRICAGIAMAERMVLYILATFLHSFNWEIPQDIGLSLEDKFGIVLKLKTPLVAVPMPRLSNPKLYE